MKKHLLNTQYWLRVLKLFFAFLPIYFIAQFIGEDQKDFWTFSHLSSSIGTAFFMAIVFSNPFRGGTQDTNNAESSELTKPTWKEFWGVYLILVIVSVSLMTALLSIGWLIMLLLSNSEQSFFNVLLKTILVTAVMVLFINGAFFLSSYWKYKRVKSEKNFGHS